MKANKKYRFRKDTSSDGRQQAFLDVDRMINEGLAGGTVVSYDDNFNIDEAHDYESEHK